MAVRSKAPKTSLTKLQATEGLVRLGLLAQREQAERFRVETLLIRAQALSWALKQTFRDLESCTGVEKADRARGAAVVLIDDIDEILTEAVENPGKDGLDAEA